MNLTDLLLADAFFQVNLLKGYRYLDTAGQIMNDLDDRFSSMQVSVQGLTVANPTDPEDHLRELRVSPDQIWLHYGVGTEWSELRQEIPQLVDRIAAIMTIGGYRRRGFRTSLLHPVEEFEAANRLLIERVYNADLARWRRFSDSDAVAFHVGTRIKRLRLTLNIRPVRVIKKPPTEGFIEEQDLVVSEQSSDKFPDFALLVDTDVYDDNRTTDLGVKPIINHAIEILTDEVTPLLSRIVGDAH